MRVAGVQKKQAKAEEVTSTAIQAFQSQNGRRWTVGIGLNLTSARKPVCYEGIKTERSASQHAVSANLPAWT